MAPVQPPPGANKTIIAANTAATTMPRNLTMIEFILYVSDQQSSKQLYQKILGQPPVLDVPGMTEFLLSEDCKLGLMPNHGIAKILGDRLPHPDQGVGIPRAELYLYVDQAELRYNRAIQAGAKAINPVCERDWGDRVGYVADSDGHIIAFAEKSPSH
jgi:lactoylglutathione lyase